MMIESLLGSEEERRALRLKSESTKGVYFSSMPGFTTRGHDAIKDARHKLLARFANAVDYVALWLLPSDAEVLPEGVLGPDFSVADKPLWIRRPSSFAVTVLDDLYRGSWGMFFGSERGLAMRGPPTLAPRGNEDRLKLTASLGAAIGVISEPDDLEWTICLVLDAKSQPSAP